jgi:hypothetical protein
VKRWPVAAAGLALGVIAGFGLVLANPLVRVGVMPPPAEAGPGLSSRYTMAEAAGLALGVVQFLGLGWGEDDLLAAAGTRGIRIGIAVLPEAAGQPPGLAVKASLLSPQNSLWRARLGLLDYWSIAWPGEGSLFATGYTNFWAPHRDLVVAVARGQGRAGLAAEYALSALPPAADDQGIHGSSGRYARARGSIRENLEPRPDGPPAWVLTLAFAEGTATP